MDSGPALNGFLVGTRPLPLPSITPPAAFFLFREAACSGQAAWQAPQAKNNHLVDVVEYLAQIPR